MQQYDRNFGANYTQPWHVMVRRDLKQMLFDAIKVEPSPFPTNSGMAIWLFGSTTLFLRQLEGYRLAFPKKKSHDLELGVYNPNNLPITVELRTEISDYFQSIFEKLGVVRLGRDKGDPNYPESEAYLGNIFLQYTATEADVTRIESQNTEMRDISLPNPLNVVLDIDISTGELPSLLRPQQSSYFKGAKTPVVQDDIRNVIAKKLARSSFPGDFSYGTSPQDFKPRDLIDIFNSFHSHPWLINYDPNKPNNDVELMRTMIIVNCVAMGKNLGQISLASFEPTDVNMAAFQRGIKPGVSSILDVEGYASQSIMMVMQKILHNIFPELKKGNGIELRPNEREFLEQLGGYRYSSTGQLEQSEPTIAPFTLLSSSLRDRYPELAGRIQGLNALREYCQRISDARSGATGADF